MNTSASEWAGSVEHTTVRRPDRAARTAVAAGDGRLADAALPGEEEYPHEGREASGATPSRPRPDAGAQADWASTAFFSSFSAVPMIIPAARRLIRPGSGIAMSTARS